MSNENSSNPLKVPEFPFDIAHVQNHIVFSYFYRFIPLSYTCAIIILISLIYGLFTTQASTASYLLNNTQNIIVFLGCVFLFSRLKYQKQAMIGWAIFKFTMLVVASLVATVGFISSYSNGKSDAFPNLFLGLTWLPSIEFIPGLLPYQKYISLVRVLLTIPCVYFGINSGYWHW